MSDEFKINFAEGVIQYNESSNQWAYRIGETTIGQRASLSDAKALATRHAKQKSTFDRHPALYRDSPWANLQSVTVTSYPDEVDYRGRRQAWISKADKSRKLVTSEDLFECNPGNIILVQEVEKLDVQAEAIRLKIKAVNDRLEPYAFRKNTTKP